MIARVLAAVLTAANADAAAGTSPAVSGGTPAAALHEIQAVPGSANMCANVVVHANAAILTTLRDDASIAHVLVRLRTADFETMGNARRAAIAEVARTSNDLSENVDRAKSETHRLREYGAHPAGLDRSAEIAAFVDPLDAALEAQRRAADGLAAFVTALEYHDMRESARQSAALHATDPDDPDTFHTAGRMPSALPTPAGPAVERTGPSPALSARAQAADLETLATEIGQDEARAAVRSEPAVGGC